MSQLTLCVQWPRFGPYHLARLRALDLACRARDIRLVGLETAAEDEIYDWRPEDGETSFERVQVFTDRPFEQILPAEMHAEVQAALERVNPDVVAIHTYSFPDSRACLEWCASRRCGTICMTDSKQDDAKRSYWREALKSHLVRCFDAALLAGTPQKAYFTALGFPPAAIHLGYDVVDNDFFADGARAVRGNPDSVRHLPGLDVRTPFFLASNRFITRKNLGMLLRAYHAYRNASASPWRLIMVGDGPLRNELQTLEKNLGLDGVTWTGFRQIDDLPGYYGLASCFVHPATVDTWGLVINEAMAAELPVIVSTGAGCQSDLVAEGVNGFTFDPTDHHSLTQHMLRMSTDDNFRIAAGPASADIISNWTLERFAESMLNATETALRRKGRGIHPLARLTIGLLRRSRSVTAFHDVES